MVVGIAIAALSHTAPAWVALLFIVLVGIVVVGKIALVVLLVCMLRTLGQVEDDIDKRRGWGKYAKKAHP